MIWFLESMHAKMNSFEKSAPWYWELKPQKWKDHPFMSMCLSPSFQFSTVSHCQHSFCSCSQQLQEGKWAETTRGDFSSSIHSPRLTSVYSHWPQPCTLYRTLCMVITPMLLTFFLVALGCELRFSCIQTKYFTDSATLPVHFPLGSPSLICLA
jgi:hypothetical protein